MPQEGTFKVQFRIGEDIAPRLAERAEENEYSHRARMDLARYYELMARTLQTVTLSRGEASLICDVLNGSGSFEMAGVHGTYMALAHEVSDGIKLDRLDEKWEIDGQALVAKILSWTPAQILAVTDSAERFWHDCNNSTVESVGLVRKPAEKNGSGRKS